MVRVDDAELLRLVGLGDSAALARLYEAPAAGAEPVEPNLEDGYLALAQSRP